MISYEPLWKTLEKQNKTKYYLKTYCNINSNLIYRLNNNLSITMYTLNNLCMILDCRVEDVIEYVPDVK